MQIFIVGAGLIGERIVSGLHEDHEVTVVDLDPARLKPLAQHYDVATAQGNAASGRDLLRAGIADAELVIACTSRDEANLVAGSFARSVGAGGEDDRPHVERRVRRDLARGAPRRRLRGLLRAGDGARAVSAAIGMPAARHTDSFAEGRVQVVELDVPPAPATDLVTGKLRSARLPGESRVAGVIRDGRPILVRGDTEIEPGDRIVVDRHRRRRRASGARSSPRGAARCTTSSSSGRAGAGRGDRPRARRAGAQRCG